MLLLFSQQLVAKKEPVVPAGQCSPIDWSPISSVRSQDRQAPITLEWKNARGRRKKACTVWKSHCSSRLPSKSACSGSFFCRPLPRRNIRHDTQKKKCLNVYIKQGTAKRASINTPYTTRVRLHTTPHRTIFAAHFLEDKGSTKNAKSCVWLWKGLPRGNLPKANIFVLCPPLSTLLEPRSRFGDQPTLILSNLSPN